MNSQAAHMVAQMLTFRQKVALCNNCSAVTVMHTLQARMRSYIFTGVTMKNAKNYATLLKTSVA
jgi:hypothetical protein